MSKKTTKSRGAFSIRFRKVADNYALMVTRAYNGDQDAAMRDDDATVAERVRQYELAHGVEPKDWVKIGRKAEGREDDEAIEAGDGWVQVKSS